MTDGTAAVLCAGWGYYWFRSMGLNGMKKRDILKACDMALNDKPRKQKE